MKVSSKKLSALAAAAAVVLAFVLLFPRSAFADTLVSEEYVIRYYSGEASFSYYIDEENTLYFAGSNGSGQYGNGAKGGEYSMPREVMQNVKTIADGKTGFAVALRMDGSLWAWGNNQYAQLGQGTEYNNDGDTNCVLIPAEMSYQSSSPVVALAAGDAFTVVLNEAGEVYTCGRAGDGQTGIGGMELTRKTVVGRLTRIDPSYFGGKKIVQIDAAENTGFALAEDGTLYIWGANDYGILGNGSVDENDIYETPVQLTFSEKIRKVSAETMTVMILTESGKVYGWGNNAVRQLGIKDLTELSVAVPTQIGAFYDADGQEVQVTVADILCGGRTNFVLDTEGRVYAFGATGNGQAAINPSESSYLDHPCISESNVVLPMRVQFYEPLSIEEEAEKETGELEGKLPVDATRKIDVRVTGLVGSIGDRTFVEDEDGNLWSWGINLYGMVCSGEADTSSCVHPVRSTLFRIKNYDKDYVTKNYMLKPGIFMACVVVIAASLFIWAEIKKRKTMRRIREGAEGGQAKV